MLTIVDYKQMENSEQEVFFALVLQGHIKIMEKISLHSSFIKTIRKLCLSTAALVCYIVIPK